MCEFRGLQLSGPPAYLIYLTVHLYYLGGALGRRLKLLTDWVTARSGNPQSQIIEGDLRTVERTEPGTAAAP